MALKTQIIDVPTRLATPPIELAKYRNIVQYNPKVGDFIIWHGLIFGHWCGIVNAVIDNKVSIVNSKLPKLLFIMDDEEQFQNAIKVPINKIRRSRGGAWAVLQDGVWYIDD